MACMLLHLNYSCVVCCLFLCRTFCLVLCFFWKIIFVVFFDCFFVVCVFDALYMLKHLWLSLLSFWLIWCLYFHSAQLLVPSFGWPVWLVLFFCEYTITYTVVVCCLVFAVLPHVAVLCCVFVERLLFVVVFPPCEYDVCIVNLATIARSFVSFSFCRIVWITLSHSYLFVVFECLYFGYFLFVCDYI